MQSNLSPPDLPPRRGGRVTRWLVIVLPVAVAVAGVAMLISIEALIGGLPACAVIGLVLSFVSAPLASWRLHLFAVSAPLMAAACAIIISSWRLSPGNAYAPINCTWWVYAIFLIAFSRRPILDVWRRAHPAHYAPANWQFSIRFMLLLTAVLSACLATTKWIIAGVESDSGSGYTARGEMMGFALAASAVVFVIGLATARFLAYRA